MKHKLVSPTPCPICRKSPGKIRFQGDLVSHHSECDCGEASLSIVTDLENNAVIMWSYKTSPEIVDAKNKKVGVKSR